METIRSRELCKPLSRGENIHFLPYKSSTFRVYTGVTMIFVFVMLVIPLGMKTLTLELVSDYDFDATVKGRAIYFVCLEMNHTRAVFSVIYV